MRQLAGRVAVITGGASGIGRATARALARREVAILIADIEAAGAIDTAAEIVAEGGRAAGLGCDVTQDTCFETLKAAVLDHFGRVDIVMNNAGGLTRGLPQHIPLAEWRRVLDVNLLSVVRSNLAFLPLLLGKGEGHIVNTASLAGLMGYAFDRLPYAASKAAVIQMSEGLAIYLRPQGIGVTVLCPGPVRTNIMASLRSFGPPTDTRGPGPGYALLQPDEVGEQVVDAILNDKFMLQTHAQIGKAVLDRARDWDGHINRQIDTPHIVAKASVA